MIILEIYDKILKKFLTLHYYIKIIKFAAMIKEQENELISRIQTGDIRAEQELLTHFHIRIARKVRIDLGTANEDWKDIVNEVQLALIESLRKGRFDVHKGTPLGSYVFGITVNKIRDYFKTRKKLSNFSSDLLQERNLIYEEKSSFEAQELRKTLRKLLAGLKVKYKEVLYLRYYQEYTVSEISQMINIPPRRVSERINYALKLLRKECQKRNFFSIFTCFGLTYF